MGYSVPDFVLSDGRGVGSLLRTGKGLLLDPDPSPSLQALAGRRSARISYVAADVRERLGLKAVLVRPDGLVPWASDTTPDEQAIDRAMTRWFGTCGRGAQADAEQA